MKRKRKKDEFHALLPNSVPPSFKSDAKWNHHNSYSGNLWDGIGWAMAWAIVFLWRPRPAPFCSTVWPNTILLGKSTPFVISCVSVESCCPRVSATLSVILLQWHDDAGCCSWSCVTAHLVVICFNLIPTLATCIPKFHQTSQAEVTTL